jgi:hypothetical protein
MATANLLPAPRFVVLDANGKPVSGGFVNTYIPGGTTPKATWQDAAQLIPNANPVPLDSAGSAQIYGWGSYQLTVTDANGVAVPGYSGVTVSNPGNPGTTTNDNAAAGQIGEYVSSNVLVGAAVALTNGTGVTVTSISLTAGDWNVNGTVDFAMNAATVTVWVTGGISLTPAVLPAPPDGGGIARMFTPQAAGVVFADLSVGTIRLSLAATTTVYLVAISSFGTNTSSAYGYIGARRAR